VIPNNYYRVDSGRQLVPAGDVQRFSGQHVAAPVLAKDLKLDFRSLRPFLRKAATAVLSIHTTAGAASGMPHCGIKPRIMINPILMGNEITLPADALIDPAFADLGAEEIYARLRKQGQESGAAQPPSQSSMQSGTAGGGGNSPEQTSQSTSAETQSTQQQSQSQPELPGLSDQPAPLRPGGFGEVLDAVSEDGQPASQGELSRQMHEWSINAEQALCSAKACGREPGGVERRLEQARQSEHHWQAILRDFIEATNPSDYRWTLPNRRFVSSGLYLPSVERSGVGEMVIVVDTSGSIGTNELEQFAGEINAIVEEAQRESIRVIYCDAAVQAVEEFGPSEPIKLSPKSGGGTDFVPPFKWVEENGIEPKCLIYLTDFCCHSFPETPEYPVLWVTDSPKTAPFGETLRIRIVG
jgi:hypothetical protein